MDLEKYINKRSKNKCELCNSGEKLSIYAIPPVKEKLQTNCIQACKICIDQLKNKEKINVNHWRCLNDSMWSEVDAVKVVAYRMLYQLKAEVWPQDLLDMMYLESETLAWAKDGIIDENTPIHKDAFGNILKSGDNVVLTQSLNVKGSSLTAKKGVVVKKISLVFDNHEHIEGRVDGQMIVILTKFVKKV